MAKKSRRRVSRRTRRKVSRRTTRSTTTKLTMEEKCAAAFIVIVFLGLLYFIL